MHPFQFNKFRYAGIGSRRITLNSSVFLMEYACCMAFCGASVDSGAADGSDTSFEVGAKIAYDALAKIFPDLLPGQYSNVMSVHLPWSGFNGRFHKPEAGYYFTEAPEAAKLVAKKHHPSFGTLADAAKSMMYRNSMQIMSRSMLDPVRFVACETPDGAYNASMTSSKTGGTGQAIRVADSQGIPIYNTKNKDHHAKMVKWVEEVDNKILKQYGVSPKALVAEYLENFKGIKKHTTGNLVEMAKRGEIDVIVHGCNLSTMNSGIAKEIREAFPEAYESFLKTKKGDKKKMGTIDCVTVERNGKPVTIVNAFVQERYGRDPDVLYVDYQAVRKCFKAVANMFDRDQRIGIPKIGAGLGNGCWVTLSNIIQLELKKHDLLLVEFDGIEPEIENDASQALSSDEEQLGFGF